MLIYVFAYCNLFLQIAFIRSNRDQQGFIPSTQYAAMTGHLLIIANYDQKVMEYTIARPLSRGAWTWCASSHLVSAKYKV